DTRTNHVAPAPAAGPGRDPEVGATLAGCGHTPLLHPEIPLFPVGHHLTADINDGWCSTDLPCPRVGHGQRELWPGVTRNAHVSSTSGERSNCSSPRRWTVSTPGGLPGP